MSETEKRCRTCLHDREPPYVEPCKACGDTFAKGGGQFSRWTPRAPQPETGGTFAYNGPLNPDGSPKPCESASSKWTPTLPVLPPSPSRSEGLGEADLTRWERCAEQKGDDVRGVIRALIAEVRRLQRQERLWYREDGTTENLDPAEVVRRRVAAAQEFSRLRAQLAEWPADARSRLHNDQKRPPAPSPEPESGSNPERKDVTNG